jgi:hypothetical protein
MKWITPIWSDPVGWSEWIAKTKWRVFIWVLVHLCFVSFGLVAMYWLLQKIDGFQENRELVLVVIVCAASPLVFIGVGFPAMYLYAMYRLLALLRAQKKTLPDAAKPKDDK